MIRDRINRIRIYKAFKLLSDKEKQLKEWTTPSLFYRIINYILTTLYIIITAGHSPEAFDLQNRYWHSLNVYVTDIILEEFGFHEGTRKYIGYIFHDHEEAQKVQSFCEYLNNLLYSIGPKREDSAYLSNFRWQDVIDGANNICILMKSKGEL